MVARVACRFTLLMPACLPVPQGVGSHAAHLLLRSGVGRLRLIDFDQLTLSSLNRHCLASRADVGTPKAACLARHFAGEAGMLLWGQVPIVAVVVCLLLAWSALANRAPPAPKVCRSAHSILPRAPAVQTSCPRRRLRRWLRCTPRRGRSGCWGAAPTLCWMPSTTLIQRRDDTGCAGRGGAGHRRAADVQAGACLCGG